MPKPSDTGNVKKRCDFKAPKDHPRRGISEKHPNGERYRQNLNVIAAESDRLAPQGYEKRRSAADITREALDAFRQQRPKVAANRNLAFLRAAFNWAVVDGLVPRSPFRVGDVAVVKLAREEARTRRLQGDEEERLLLAANGLRPLIVGALETGCRLGELLSLQWS